MNETTGLKTQDEGWHEHRKGLVPERLATWLALASLLISVGHVVYAIWRDHINGGEGLLSLLG